jgi:segregation and condensation protein A
VRLEVSAVELAALAARTILKPTEPDLDHLDLELPSVSVAIDEVRRRVAESVDTDFDRLTAHVSGTVEVIAYFLAMLELARWGLLEASQPDLADPIRLRHVREADEGLESEWAR